MTELGGCDKLAFATERQAKIKAREINAGKPGHKHQTRKHMTPYPCPLCKAWHLTSQSNSRQRRFRRRHP